MREEEAKAKMCPNLYHASVVMAFKLKEDTDIEKAMTLSLCQGSDCMMWAFDGDGFERITTNNLTADQETMMKRIKSHPSELSIWQTPKGEPCKPAGEGWGKDGDMEQAKGYSDGCFKQRWKRRIEFSGHCGLTR